MKSVDRPSRGVGRSTAADLSASRPKPKLKNVLPEVWELISRAAAAGRRFLLMIINLSGGLVLPASTKYLIDNVIAKHQVDLLPILVAVVVLATFIQGITSFALTQLLSKVGAAPDRGTAEKVQAHIGGCRSRSTTRIRPDPGFAHHDRCGRSAEPDGNRAGRFCGGLLTALFAFGYSSISAFR